MLSKKMAFSLMSLITLLAFAFITVPVMAVDDFDATFSVDSISTMSDHNAEYNKPIVVTLTFGAKVNGATIVTADMPVLTVLVEDKFGAQTPLVPAPTITAKDIDRVMPLVQNNSQAFTFTIPINATDMNDVKVHLYVPGGAMGIAELTPGSVKTSKAGVLAIDLVGPAPTNPRVTDPTVISIATSPQLLVPADGHIGGAFDVIITLSERPKEFTAAYVGVDKGTAAAPVYLGGVVLTDTGNDMVDDDSTGTTGMLHQYKVTITPKAEDGDLVVKVNAFEDQVKGERLISNEPGPPSYDINEVKAATANMYTPASILVEGMTKLTVKIKQAPVAALAAGHEVLLTNKRVIPAGGYLIVATDPAMTGINLPTGHDADDNTPKINERSPAELLYNAIKVGLPDLESFLGNGGTIDLVSPNAGLVISEIMWGSDASLAENSQSQWIEIHNTTAANIATGDKTHKLIFYGPNETVPAKTAAVAATATAVAVAAALPAGVVDRVGTIDDKGGYWSLAGKGQSGRTGQDEKALALTAIIPTQSLVSMYRVMVPSTDPTALAGAMMSAYGNTAAAWMQSTPPATNMDPAKGGNRIASPGADRIITAAAAAAAAKADKAKADAAAAAAAKAADTSVSMPKVGQVYISEVMFAGGGTLPQWIEISNGSRSEQVNLSGWTLTVENATADADVSVGAKAVFTIPEGTLIDPSGQSDTPSTILVVTEHRT